jgi:hypothetical protein
MVPNKQYTWDTDSVNQQYNFEQQHCGFSQSKCDCIQIFKYGTVPVPGTVQDLGIIFEISPREYDSISCQFIDF